MKLKRLLSAFLAVALMLSTVTIVSAGSSDYGAMEFVVTADKTSVSANETVVLTITGNGRMSNLSTIQYQIVFDPTEFSTGKNAKNAFEAGFYATVSGGNGIGAIATPKFALKNGTGGKQIGTLTAMDSSLSGETEDGDMYMLFISEDCDLYGKTTATMGKIVFTALKDIDDISECFTIQAAKTAYGDETGTLASNISGTVVQLSETVVVTKVMNLINAIGSPVTYSSKSAIEAARSAYDAITSDAVKAQVTNIGTLTAAEAALKAITDEIDRVKGLIDALDSASATFEADIQEAEQAYNALADDAKTALPGYDAKIASAKETLAQLKEEEADRAEAAKVDALIEAIGTVTLDSGDAIANAETAWQALTEKQQGYVTKYSVLTKARQDYNTMVANRALAEEIEELINLIPAQITNENAETARNLIEDARVSYDESADAVKELVLPAVYDKLTTAEETLISVDKAEAAKVDALIDAIGTVTLGSQWDILEAENAYNALSDAQKKHVEKYDTLVKAANDYNIILSNKEAAQEIETLINAIPSPITRENAEDARIAINVARSSYNSAGDAIQNFVGEDVYKKLTDAEAELIVADKDIADAVAVEKLIDAIGEVTLASKAKLDAIAVKLGELSPEALSYVDSERIKKYDSACERYAVLEAEQAQVQAVIDEIAALGDVEDITLEDKDAIESAEAAFALLTTALQDRVTNAQALRDIRVKLNALIKSEADVNSVIKLINEIGEVTLNSSAKINAARSAYDSLTEEEQARVENYEVLTDAEVLYEELFQAAEQEKIDQAAAQGVDELINAIGTVELTPECEALIKAAENAYALLTENQKQLVEGAMILAQARVDYDNLKADKEAVDEVIAIIDAIGTVEYSDECLVKIEVAELAYNNLREDLKERVTNADKIEFSKRRYEELKADTEAVANVIDVIDEIGTVSWTKESLDKIEKARAAYDALRDDLKEGVVNADKLTEAEETYKSLKPVFSQKQDVEAYDGNHMTVITNVPEDMTVSDGNCDAVLVKIGENVYHVFVTDHAVAEADIVLRHEAPAVHELGNVNGDSRITANDAQMACQYAARKEVEIFAIDPIAFIRADVNGSGSITALDALMIANKAAGEDVEFNLLTGLIKE